MRKPSDASPRRPDQIGSYFRSEAPALLVVTLSGLLYNVGLLAGPWFEGQLTQCLVNVLGKSSTFSDMLRLTLAYVAVIAAVQGARYVKRLYVRKFANSVNRAMKQTLYGNLVHASRAELIHESTGRIMTKAIADVDACAEGMRKFTTEIFDTGVALAGYAVLLVICDWRLAVLCLAFPPVSYILAEKMKTLVQRTGAEAKQSAGRLQEATLDRVSGALTYRVFGCEARRDEAYESCLTDYERKAVSANLWGAAMPPLYRVISFAGMVFILYFGAKNVTGTGWATWDIAAFTTFLACYTKLSLKSANAAKLFNAVQKAEVSWKRIQPLMKDVPEDTPVRSVSPAPLVVKDLSFAYPGEKELLHGVSFRATPGEIIGVTGPVACGKSTLGKVFLCESPYSGSIRFGGRELREMSEAELSGTIGYLGHDPELRSDTLASNVLWGDPGDPAKWLRAVDLADEADAMPEGAETLSGSGGVRLSGGQQARLALARTLCHKRPVMILDDPFAALDRDTERQVFSALRRELADCVVILISHRLYLFPELSQVMWMEDGHAVCSTHAELMKSCAAYAALSDEQQKGGERLEA